MAKAMIEFGHWTPDQAAQHLAETPSEDIAFDPLAPPVAKAEAPQGVNPIDAAAFAGPDTPAAYRFEPAPEGVETDMQQELAIRTLFHAEQVPVPIAKEVARQNPALVIGAPSTRKRMKIREWLADRGHLEATQPIANELRKLQGVDDYEYVTIPTHENGSTPESPGPLVSVRCVPDHVDKTVTGYVTLRW